MIIRQATGVDFWCAFLKEKLIAAGFYQNVAFIPSLVGREVLSSAFTPDATLSAGLERAKLPN